MTSSKTWFSNVKIQMDCAANGGQPGHGPTARQKARPRQLGAAGFRENPWLPGIRWQHGNVPAARSRNRAGCPSGGFERCRPRRRRRGCRHGAGSQAPRSQVVEFGWSTAFGLVVQRAYPLTFRALARGGFSKAASSPVGRGRRRSPWRRAIGPPPGRFQLCQDAARRAASRRRITDETGALLLGKTGQRWRRRRRDVAIWR